MRNKILNFGFLYHKKKAMATKSQPINQGLEVYKNNEI